MPKVYNKAIRDKIPTIIKASGKKAKIIRVEDTEFLQHLEVKLQEELDEYEASKDIEELADMVEVIYAILRLKGCSLQAFEQLRQEKNDRRGSFQDNLFLVEVE